MLAVSGPGCICHHSWRVCFLVYTAQAPDCSAGELSKVGPGLRALPRSTPLRFRLSGTPQWHRVSWTCVLFPSQVWAAQMMRCLVSAVNATYRLSRPCQSVFWIYSWCTFSGRWWLLSKTMGCFSGCLMSSAGIQKLFCGICSAFKCSFDEFVGEKVVSPSYSSTILGPPLLLTYVFS